MATVGTTYTFRDVSLREDLRDLVSLYGRQDRPFTSILGTTKASQPLHIWVEDTLAARALNAQLEAFDFAVSAADAGTRKGNMTSVMKKDVFVSKTTILSNVAGAINEVTKQVKKRTIELMNDREFNYLLSTLITGAAGTARQMDGLVQVAMTNNRITVNCGVSFGVQQLSDLQDNLRANGLNATDALLMPAIKRRISSAATSVQKYTYQGEHIISETISIYEGDFGVTELWVCRDFSATMFGGTASHSHTVVFDRSMFNRAVIHDIMLTTAAPRERGVLSVLDCEETLEYLSIKGAAIDFNHL